MAKFFSSMYVPTSFSATSFPLSATLPITLKSSIKSSRPCSFHSHSPSCSSSSVSPKKANFDEDKPCHGAEILVEALERKGVETVFAYPGGASMHIHKYLNRSNIRKVLPRHEQGGIFAAEGYAKSTGKPGVCIVTSGPEATNLVTGLQDAMLDSVSLIAITGQDPLDMIGTGAFQDTPIVEVTRSITKHCYLVKRVEDIPRIIDEAFFIATSGRPGPVLIDVPKDVQQQIGVPKWEQSMQLPLQFAFLPKPIEITDLEEIVRMISESKKPVLYIGGGCVDSSHEIHKFSELTQIPLATTFMGKLLILFLYL